MPWVKLDDQIMRNPKVRAVSRDAFAMHIAGFCYCATALTDGRIPDRDIPLVAAEALAPEASAGELGAVGLWERRSDGWEIHDYLDYQPSRADVLEDRAKARDRKRAQRDRQKGHGGSHAVTDAVTDQGSHAGSPAPPVPSRPVHEDPPSISGLTRYGLDAAVLWGEVAQLDLAAEIKRGGKVHSPDGWLVTARARAEQRYASEAEQIAATFVVEDEHTLAELLVGKRAKTYLDRRSA